MMKSVIGMLVITTLLFTACKENKKYHDTAKQEAPTASSDAVADILEFQKELNDEFKDPETSPLPDRYRMDFETLDFFAPDTTYVVLAKLVRTPEALPFMMPTTTGRKSEEAVFGIAHFTLNGEKRQLEIYQNQELMEQEEYRDYLFLPFTDKTNGEETYSGGRYIDLEIPDGDSIQIDFNTAYNPYCAYNPKYSCPIVPDVNALDTEVRAGVRAFDPK
ncbi:DUF1684 domain-containing protein [Pricia sp. S334]|uniref:DUF1684 domain-containing protein n=1 Tax=Pricia mediterranea TaxID=3076079 RepID=A0ABU3L957_9FLAO|nr:DUF1684 domain-containing protein [Pricia sp. S334]MDT7829719.1 DUF1684 domain-containing protein [Pricia sp. S334]